MRIRHRFISAVILLAVLIIGAGVILLMKSGGPSGIMDDYKDVRITQVIDFAERSNSAYHEEKDFRHEYGPHIEHGEFPDSGLRVYLDRNPGNAEQWVVIRGTANMQDVIDDLEFFDRNDHELGINVHAGFDRCLQDCLPWILARLDKTRPVRVTGHSLGGSVAALLVATLDHRGFKNVSAITFGQPKFTDAHGAAKLAHLDILRIVHDEDPIPMLPPVGIEGNSFTVYHHCGPEVIVKASGHFTYLPAHDADRLDVSGYLAEIKRIRPISHDMVKGYLPALKSALNLPHLPVKASVGQ